MRLPRTKIVWSSETKGDTYYLFVECDSGTTTCFFMLTQICITHDNPFYENSAQFFLQYYCCVRNDVIPNNDDASALIFPIVDSISFLCFVIFIVTLYRMCVLFKKSKCHKKYFFCQFSYTNFLAPKIMFAGLFRHRNKHYDAIYVMWWKWKQWQKLLLPWRTFRACSKYYWNNFVFTSFFS